VIGLAVAGQHEPVSAGVRAVQQAETVRRRLHVEVRPDGAVDRGEGAEALHHLRIGLVQQIACEPAVVVEVEVAVAQQERHLVRWSFGQLELSLAIIADDPQTCQTGVDVEARHAHHVVVVPEHRRTLVVRIRVEHRLAGGRDVFRPPIARGLGHAAVQVNDREARQTRRSWVGMAPASSRRALRRYPVDGELGRDRDDDRQRCCEVVLPANLELHAPVDLDRRTRMGSAVGPDPRRREIAMEKMLSGLEPDDDATRLGEDESSRHRHLVDERRQRRLQRLHREKPPRSARHERRWPCGFLAARTQTIVSFSDVARRGSGEDESMPAARAPKKTFSKRHEPGREAPMIITPAALLRLVKRIRGRGAKR
jgi:hypothetical protein